MYRTFSNAYTPEEAKKIRYLVEVTHSPTEPRPVLQEDWYVAKREAVSHAKLIAKYHPDLYVRVLWFENGLSSDYPIKVYDSISGATEESRREP